LGDASNAHVVEALARAFAAAGARYVKVGFAGIGDRDRALALAAAAVRGAAAGQGQTILVAYADADPTTHLTAATLLDVALCAGARGVLLDTADKHGPGLRALMPAAKLTAWIDRAHEHGLLAAVAGKVTADDLPCARDAGADIVVVRGAACEGGRICAVSTERVRLLSTRCREISRVSQFTEQQA
jgi:uncharacterized protein (UPF0264 family)